MTQTLMNRSTATRQNALTESERDAFLNDLRIGRLATMREDGWPHVTPIWYVWEDGRFLLTLGKSRRHLGNIARDPHVTLIVDEDPRTSDLTKSPRAVVCYGFGQLVEDDVGVREITAKVEDRYLPADVRGPELEELIWFEGRVGVEIEPVRWLAWDQGKGG
jgi:nitroimidazol reductase NimA-like FMN-containing flavoprotein (pyridoxamine 5'-phosphate oxidase superfamily)